MFFIANAIEAGLSLYACIIAGHATDHNSAMDPVIKAADSEVVEEGEAISTRVGLVPPCWL